MSELASNLVQEYEGLPPLLTVEEAARWLRISRNLCYELIRQDQIPSIRLGSRIRVPRYGLEVWLARQVGMELPAPLAVPSVELQRH